MSLSQQLHRSRSSSQAPLNGFPPSLDEPDLEDQVGNAALCARLGRRANDSDPDPGQGRRKLPILPFRRTRVPRPGQPAIPNAKDTLAPVAGEPAQVSSDTGSTGSGGQGTGADMTSSSPGDQTGTQMDTPTTTSPTSTDTSSVQPDGSTTADTQSETGPGLLDGLLAWGHGLLQDLGLVDTDLETFMAHTWGPMEYTTKIGGFEAMYIPGTGQMVVSLRLAMNFLDGDPGKAPPGTDPAQLTWTDAEKDLWSKAAIAQAQEAWSDRFQLKCTRPGFEALPPADVQVCVNCVEPAQAHHQVDIHKLPETGERDDMENLYENPADVPGMSEPDSVNRQFYPAQPLAENAQTCAPLQAVLPLSVPFEDGSWALTPSAQGSLDKVADALQVPGLPPFPLTVWGQADTGETEENQAPSLEALADRRAQVVRGRLEGVSPGEIQVSSGTYTVDAPFLRSVDVDASTLDIEQNIWLHEFGHMLGLPDQYADTELPWCRAPGDKVDLPEFTVDGQEARPDLARDDERIMSCGNAFEPAHYSLFADALGQVTNMPGEWTILSGK